MISKIKFLLLFFLFHFICFSQNEFFVRSYNGGPTKMIDIDSTGCYFQTTSANTIFKTNLSGNVLWAKTYGISYGNFTAKRLGNGDFILLNQIGTTNIHLVRIDSSGSILWSKNFHNLTAPFYNNSLIELSSKNIVVGFGLMNNEGLNDSIGYFIVDENGSLLSSKKFTKLGIYSFVGNNIVLRAYNNNDFIILSEYLAFEQRGIYGVKIKADTDSIIWKNIVGSEDLNENKVVLKNNELTIASIYRDYTLFPTVYDYHVLNKFDSSGYGIAYKNHGIFPPPSEGIHSANDNGFFFTKYNYIYKLDSVFNTEWKVEISISISGIFPPIINKIIHNRNNEIYISLYKNTSPSSNCHYFIKADSSCISACGIGSVIADNPPGFLGSFGAPINDSTSLYNLNISESNYIETSTTQLINSDLICTTSVGQAESISILFDVAPNPCNDYLIISKKSNIENYKPFDISIYNIFGNCVFKQIKVESATTVYTKNLSSGVYYVSIVSENSVQNYKIVKE